MNFITLTITTLLLSIFTLKGKFDLLALLKHGGAQNWSSNIKAIPQTNDTQESRHADNTSVTGIVAREKGM